MVVPQALILHGSVFQSRRSPPGWLNMVELSHRRSVCCQHTLVLPQNRFNRRTTGLKQNASFRDWKPAWFRGSSRIPVLFILWPSARSVRWQSRRAARSEWRRSQPVNGAIGRLVQFRKSGSSWQERSSVSDYQKILQRVSYLTTPVFNQTFAAFVSSCTAGITK